MMCQQKNKGFTLVEMLVVIAIVAIITTIVLVKNQGFHNSTILKALAFDVALSIREAQSSGLSVRETGIGTGDFETAHGIRFGTDYGSCTQDPTVYFSGADTSDDNTIDVGEIEDTFTLKEGYKISRICGNTTAATSQSCSTDTCLLSITFDRPNPDATIYRPAGEYWVYAEVHLESPAGEEQIIVVRDTGQISIESPVEEE